MLHTRKSLLYLPQLCCCVLYVNDNLVYLKILKQISVCRATFFTISCSQEHFRKFLRVLRRFPEIFRLCVPKFAGNQIFYPKHPKILGNFRVSKKSLNFPKICHVSPSFACLQKDKEISMLCSTVSASFCLNLLEVWMFLREVFLIFRENVEQQRIILET